MTSSWRPQPRVLALFLLSLAPSGPKSGTARISARLSVSINAAPLILFAYRSLDRRYLIDLCDREPAARLWFCLLPRYARQPRSLDRPALPALPKRPWARSPLNPNHSNSVKFRIPLSCYLISRTPVPLLSAVRSSVPTTLRLPSSAALRALVRSIQATRMP
jgi:hypothetical protein